MSHHIQGKVNHTALLMSRGVTYELYIKMQLNDNYNDIMSTDNGRDLHCMVDCTYISTAAGNIFSYGTDIPEMHK